jgi:hypothetical protein
MTSAPAINASAIAVIDITVLAWTSTVIVNRASTLGHRLDGGICCHRVPPEVDDQISPHLPDSLHLGDEAHRWRVIEW